MSNSAKTLDPKYIEWLHTLTGLGYKKGIMMSRVHEQLCELLYVEGKQPEEAIIHIEEVLQRVDAINADPL